MRDTNKNKLYLLGPPEDGDKIQSLKGHIWNKRQGDE
jgi:hypothetical protein